MLNTEESTATVSISADDASGVTAYQLDGHVLRLRMDDRVFRPTLTTKLLGECLQIEPGAEVLDIGCGIGPLGIYAARKGARFVMCLDVMPEACELARSNAVLNEVGDKVHVINSDLFEAVKGRRFDTVIDDISGIADEVARLSSWYPYPIPTGGADGAAPVLRMLQEVTRFLKPGGTLYLPVSSLSRMDKIADEARKVFGGHLEVILDRMIPFSPELYRHRTRLEELREQGIIGFESRRSRYLWNLKVFQGRHVGTPRPSDSA